MNFIMTKRKTSNGKITNNNSELLAVKKRKNAKKKIMLPVKITVTKQANKQLQAQVEKEEEQSDDNKIVKQTEKKFITTEQKQALTNFATTQLTKRLIDKSTQERRRKLLMICMASITSVVIFIGWIWNLEKIMQASQNQQNFQKLEFNQTGADLSSGLEAIKTELARIRDFVEINTLISSSVHEGVVATSGKQFSTSTIEEFKEKLEASLISTTSVSGRPVIK